MLTHPETPTEQTGERHRAVSQIHAARRKVWLWWSRVGGYWLLWRGWPRNWP